jgi:hypothetical protein
LRACLFVAATQVRPGCRRALPKFVPARGWRAEKRKSDWCPRSLRDHGGRLAARHTRIKHMRSSRPEAGSASLNLRMLFRGRFFGRRAALSLGCYPLLLRDRASRSLSALRITAARLRARMPQHASIALHGPEGESATDKSSACSRRGLVVDPGGAPAPPECSGAKGTRGRRTPSRDQDASRARPSNGRGEAMIRQVLGGGDKAGS